MEIKEKNLTKNFYFNSDVAEKYGINEAILLQNIVYWIEHNALNKLNFNEGRTWTYNSSRAFALQFKFMTKDQITYALKNLVKKGVLITGNYNKMKYDRTTWYALKDESMWGIVYPDPVIEKNDKKPISEIYEMDKGNLRNGLSEIPKSKAENHGTIPNINTDKNTNIKTNTTIPPPADSIENVVVCFDKKDTIGEMMIKALNRTFDKATFDNWHSHYEDANKGINSPLKRWLASFTAWEKVNPPQAPEPVKRSFNPYQQMSATPEQMAQRKDEAEAYLLSNR